MLNQLLNQTVTIYPASTADRYGKPSYGTGVSVSARVEERGRTIFNTPIGVNSQAAEAIPIDATIFVDADAAVSIGDKITATSAHDSSSINFKVIKKNVQVGRNGTAHHVELLVQKWV